MRRIIIWTSLFAIAMAFLESAVVVYLREILYPEGFAFPLKPIEGHLVVTELWREVATMVMLVSAGILAGRNGIERFAFFLYSFAVWDIFYYVFLKVLIDWPESLLTWDVLFLLPVTWTGPVITPIIISLLMILMAAELIYLRSFGPLRVKGLDWTIMISGAIVVIVAFCWDYAAYVLQGYSFSDWWELSDDTLFDLSVNYVPRDFNWMIFSLGLVLILVSMLRIFRKDSAKDN